MPAYNSESNKDVGDGGGGGRAGGGGAEAAWAAGSAAGSAEPRCVVGGATAFVLRVSSFAGLAPLRFERAANGWTVAISLPMCVYSYCLFTALAIGTIWGLVDEIHAGVEHSVRMKSRMLQAVSICDILVVVLTAGSGVYGAPGRMRKIIKFMDMLATVDSSVGMEYSMLSERKSCALVVALLLSVLALLADDFRVYAAKARQFDRQWTIVENYLGFYLLYTVVVILELQFAFTAYAVRKRFRAVNDALAVTARHSSLLVEDIPERGPVNMFAGRIAPVDPHARPSKNVGLLVDSLMLYRDPSPIINQTSGDGEGWLAVPPGEAVSRLSALYGLLQGAVRLLNASYGLPLLMILVSALLHLIVTPYFLILDLMSPSNHVLHFMVLQFCWAAAHFTRMWVVVEPCHRTTIEVRRTEELVSRLMGVASADGSLLPRLELFARQLLLCSVSFSPLGLCTLDRPLVASIIGAVTTYLVILIQFQRSDI